MKKEISVIGGDLRQLTVARRLAEKGFVVELFGFDQEFPGTMLPRAQSCQQAAAREIVVLPIPLTTDRKTLNAPFAKEPILVDALMKTIHNNTILLAGKPPVEVVKQCQARNIKIYDYFDREELTIKNAIATAEGALEIAIAETPKTIYQSRCMVIGYGRIGKVLSKMLAALGAEVSVSARKQADFAWIAANGYHGCNTNALAESIEQYDIIFNTVPAMVLDRAVLAKVRTDTLVIDLASKPGGVDFSLAKEMGLQVIWALSLPGKTAPISAGEIIAETICNIFEEEGV